MMQAEKGRKGSAVDARRPKRKKIVLTFSGQPGQEVFVAGTFNGWDTQSKRMRETRAGEFSITMMLPIGEHEYKFFSDGVWYEDPQGTQFRENRFGSRNTVIEVGNK